MEVVVIRWSRNLFSLSNFSSSLEDWTSSFNRDSLSSDSSADAPSKLIALLFLPVQAPANVAVVAKHTDAVFKVDVVELVLTKNSFGCLSTCCLALLQENKNILGGQTR